MNWRTLVLWVILVGLGASLLAFERMRSWAVFHEILSDASTGSRPDTTHLVLRARIIDVSADSVEIHVEEVVVP